jgi:hypothetical protein
MTGRGVTIERIDGWRGVGRFVDVAWKVNSSREGSLWVPPLRMAVKDSLDAKKNPFYRDADRALFIAMRGGTAVGRVAAVENRAHNRHHDDRVGFFGFFECENDPEAAHALLEAAELWLSDRGLDRARGPVSPSMNHESGLLVDGFDTPPVLMTPWNPEYFGSLIESAGYVGVQDLLGYDIPSEGEFAVPDRLQRMAERTKRRTGVTFRTLDVDILEREARKVLDLFCDAWAGNWGFVPPAWDEFWHTAKDLKMVLAPEFSFVAEVDGEMVGFMMLARDLNEVLASVPSGRLTPVSLFKLLTRLPRVNRGRVVLLGLREEYRHRGLFPLFFHEAAMLARNTGLRGAEASWILDDNEALVGPMDAMGLRAYKRWRIYERELAG